MRKNIRYEFHHLGIPVRDDRLSGTLNAKTGMYTEDNPGNFRVQWHRFTDDTSIHPLIRMVPHVAFRVESLQEAIRGEQLIFGPCEPVEGVYVAMINDAGVPVELIETNLMDEEVLARVHAGKGKASAFRK